MKSFMTGIAALLMSSSLLAAPSDIIVNPRLFVTYAHDEMITKITESRVSLLVASNGPAFRKDCFKEYRLNFPHAPQTVSYTIEMNFPVKISKNVITIEKAAEKANELANSLRSKINTGCKAEISILALIEGETNNGLFKSELQFYITKEGVKIQSGAVQEKVTLGVSKNINLIPSAFQSSDWSKTWAEFDPSITGPRKNY